MAVVPAQLVHLQTVLQHELQAVLLLPVATALDRDVDTLVAVPPATHHRLAAGPNVLPKFVRRFDGLLAILQPPLLKVLVVAKERLVGCPQNGRTARKK